MTVVAIGACRAASAVSASSSAALWLAGQRQHQVDVRQLDFHAPVQV